MGESTRSSQTDYVYGKMQLYIPVLIQSNIAYTWTKTFYFAGATPKENPEHKKTANGCGSYGTHVSLL